MEVGVNPITKYMGRLLAPGLIPSVPPCVPFTALVLRIGVWYVAPRIPGVIT